MGPRPRQQPMRRSRADSRAAILDAASRIFAAQGLSGARADVIAATAGVNKALLYYYFGSKEGLYWAVLEEQVIAFQQKAVAVLAQDGPAGPILLEYVGTHFDFIRAHPYYPRLFQRMVMAGDRRAQRLAAERLAPVASRLDALLRRGIRDGEVRPCDVLHTAISLVALTVFYFAAAPVVRLVSGVDPLSPAQLRKRKAEVLAFVRHGLLTSAEVRR